MKKEETGHITFRSSAALRRRLDAISSRTGVKFSEHCRRACEDYIKAYCENEGIYPAELDDGSSS